jgi:hypothetical protein
MFQSLKNLYVFIRNSEERRTQEKARLGRVFLGYVMIPVIIGFSLLAMNAYRQSSWPRTTAAVVNTRIEAPPQGKGGFYCLLVTYTYSTGGKSFRGSGPIVNDSDPEALKHRQEDEFPRGANIQIAYNPDDPSESSLTRGAAQMPVLFFVLAIFMSFMSYNFIRTKPLTPSKPWDFD